MSNTSTRTTAVLVDPTSPDGETSLRALRDRDDHVLVVVLLTGRTSNALHERAHHEQTSLVNAAWSYLDQVAVRVERPGRVVGTIVAAGPDPAYELAVIAIEHDVDRVVLPTSVIRIDRRVARRLAHLAPVSIESPRLATTVPV